MPRKITRLLSSKILSLLLLALHVSLWAQPLQQPMRALDNGQPEFNLKQANKTFDQLNLHLSIENLNLTHLEGAIQTLNTLMNDANTYIAFNQKKLSSLDTQIDEAEHQKDTDKVGADLVYLKQEQKKISDKIAQCRLFSIRAQEAIDTYQATVSKIKQQQVLSRGLPLWTLLAHIQTSPPHSIFALPPTLQLPTLSDTLLIQFGSVTVICILLVILILRKLKTHRSARQCLRQKQIGFSDGLLLFICLLGTCITCYLVNTLPTQSTPTAALISELLIVSCAYLWALAALILVFKIKFISAAFYWYSLDYYFFRNVLIFLLTYYTISQIGTSILQTLTLSDILWQLEQIMFLSAVVITTIGFFYYFCHTHQHIRFIQRHHKLLQRMIACLFLTWATLDILGYHQLALHLTYASITSFAVIFSLFLLLYGIQKLYDLCAHSSTLHHGIMRVFGYKTHQTMVEFVILKITLQLIVFCIALYGLGKNWGYGSYYIDGAYSQLLNGVHFANFTFYPTRIIAGILVFCVLYLLSRSISTKLSRHAEFEEEEETQVAVASILTYTGFACALVAALLIAGIDFTGLAIVAGALSVGIGLGLQSIVNNFVSGIILLIEKPIKPGDRISIDGIEGIVKKIRVRSTQIATAAREDVIIPNSDLITHPVTNYMFSDHYLSIHCEVGVAYGSDPLQVEKLLLQAVSEHDEVVKTARAKPNVLLHHFGESAMVFQIWFLIKDGNKKSSVHSDINFSIERLFREHDIKIAHPQRDINIKLSEIPAKIRDK